MTACDADELLSICYDRAAPLARRVAAARLWIALEVDDPDGHAPRVAGLLRWDDRWFAGPLPVAPLDHEEPTPPADWAPRAA